MKGPFQLLIAIEISVIIIPRHEAVHFVASLSFRFSWMSFRPRVHFYWEIFVSKALSMSEEVGLRYF